MHDTALYYVSHGVVPHCCIAQISHIVLKLELELKFEIVLYCVVLCYNLPYQTRVDCDVNTVACMK